METSVKEATAKQKVLIVDDHPVLRKGLCQLIDAQADLGVCGEAEDAWSALKLAEEKKPDLALVDLSLKESSGIDLIRDLIIRQPGISILVLSMHNEMFYAERVLRIGAKGYITKGEPSTRIIEGIRRVLAGEIFVSEKVANRIVSRFGGIKNDSKWDTIDTLSDREFEVFHMLGQGLQTREVAERLHLSIKTIDAHRENIKGKLDLKDANELLKTAIQWVQFEQSS